MSRSEASGGESRQKSPEALAWAEKMRFSTLAGWGTIIEAYEAHKRLIAKIKARRAAH
jgi:hypothetical protein